MTDTCDTWVKKYRPVIVALKDGTMIAGKLNIGEFLRVSDFFRQSPERFFVLSDAEHRGVSGKVIIVNKSEIIWAEPDDKDCN